MVIKLRTSKPQSRKRATAKRNTHTTPRQRKHKAALLRGDTSATPLIWSTVSQQFALHATAGRWCCTLIVRSPSIGDSWSAVIVLGAELYETSHLTNGLS